MFRFSVCEKIVEKFKIRKVFRSIALEINILSIAWCNKTNHLLYLDPSMIEGLLQEKSWKTRNERRISHFRKALFSPYIKGWQKSRFKLHQENKRSPLTHVRWGLESCFRRKSRQTKIYAKDFRKRCFLIFFFLH